MSTNATTKHTLTPWELSEYHGDVRDGDGELLATAYEIDGHESAGANAAFIVQACNSNEQLVEALNRTVLAIENLGHCEGGLSGRDELEKACDQMVDALAAAGEKP